MDDNTFLSVASLAELDRAIENANGRAALLRIRAYWDITDEEMDKTFSSACVQEILAGILLLVIDVSDNSADERELMARYEVYGPPWILLFDDDGHYLDNRDIVGYQTEARIAASLREAFDLQDEQASCSNGK